MLNVEPSRMHIIDHCKKCGKDISVKASEAGGWPICKDCGGTEEEPNPFSKTSVARRVSDNETVRIEAAMQNAKGEWIYRCKEGGRVKPVFYKSSQLKPY